LTPKVEMSSSVDADLPDLVHVAQSGHKLQDLINSLLDYFRVESIPEKVDSETRHWSQVECTYDASREDEYRDEAERLFQGGATTVGKQHFTSLYSRAREKAFTKRNIMAGWAACGLFPFNPDRVLRVTPKPPVQSTVPRADEIEVGASHQDDVPTCQDVPPTRWMRRVYRG
jgi:hypothetical protein